MSHRLHVYRLQRGAAFRDQLERFAERDLLIEVIDGDGRNRPYLWIGAAGGPCFGTLDGAALRYLVRALDSAMCGDR